MKASKEPKSMRAVLSDLSMRFEDMRQDVVKSEDALYDKVRAYLSEANRMNEENSDLRLRLQTAREYCKSCEHKAAASTLVMITSCIVTLAMAAYFFVQRIQ